MKTKTIFLFIVAILFLINESAFARAGGRSFGSGGKSSSSYSNQGSRGSRTYEGGSANGKSYNQMDKSTASKTGPSNPNSANNSANNNNANNNSQPQNNSSFFQRNPMMSTFGAALAGTWLGSMLFGSHANAMAGANGVGGGGMFSGLMPIILIGLAIWLVIKFANRNNSSNNSFGNANNIPSGSNFGDNSGYSANADQNMKIVSQNIILSASESQKFAEILIEVQNAWSVPDMEGLKNLVTPEILKYFSDALRQNQSQNLQNKIENLQVTKVDVSEAWQEEDLQYATAILQWSALDYTINLSKETSDPLYICEGDNRNPSQACEAWTFVRYGDNGNWILSAIAQIS